VFGNKYKERRLAGLPQLVGILALPRPRFPCSERFGVLRRAR